LIRHIPIAATALVDLHGHLDELPIVGIYEMGQLEGVVPDIAAQGGSDILLKGVDGLNGGISDDVADNDLRTHKDQNQRDYNHQQKAAIVSPFECRLSVGVPHRHAPFLIIPAVAFCPYY
jgi:hypothetical protein